MFVMSVGRESESGIQQPSTGKIAPENPATISNQQRVAQATESSFIISTPHD